MLPGLQKRLTALPPTLRCMKTDYASLRSQVRNFSNFYGAAISDAKKQVCKVILSQDLATCKSHKSEVKRPLFGRYPRPLPRCPKPTKTFLRNTGKRLRCAGSTTSSWWNSKVRREMKSSQRRKCDELASVFAGNIRVLCRVKPVLKEDRQHNEGQSVVVTTDPNNESSLSVLNKGKSRVFEMDKVLHPQATQEEVRGTGHTGRTWGHNNICNRLFGCIRCFRRSSLWWRPALMAITSAYLHMDRQALEKPTPWRYVLL